MPRVRAARWMTAVGTAVALAALWCAPTTTTSALVLDLATGGVLMMCGVIATVRAGQSRSGPLMFGVGLSWFFADFATLPSPIGLVASTLTYLHRGVLIHLLMTFPTGRTRGRAAGAVIVVGYALSAAPAVWSSPPVAVGLAVGLTAATAVRYLRSPGRYRRNRGVAAWCSAVITAAVITAAVVRDLAATTDLSELTLRFYEVTLMATAVALLVSLLEAGQGRRDVADLVVEVSAGGGLQSGLAWALGDPGLRLRRAPHGDEGTDTLSGPPLADHLGSNDHTPVRAPDGATVAVIEHTHGLLSDARLRAAVGSVVLLDARNRQLREDLAVRVAQVRAARGRLLDADDAEGRRLDQRLREGAADRLDRIADGVNALEHRSGDCGPSLRDAREALEVTRADLAALALGLSPVALLERGLGAALESVAAAAAPLEVDVVIDVAEPTDSMRLTAYFCVSELLTNVVKHARARRARVSITADGPDLVVTVSDDGVGGARPAAGGGLVGLTDRVAARGGTVEIDSRPGGSTVRVCLPGNVSGSSR